MSVEEAVRYETILTAQGAAALAACILDGTKLEITHIAAGDGGGAWYRPREEQSALVRETWRGKVLACEKNPLSANMLDIKGIIPSDAGGFVVRELGVFDKDGTLIGVCNTPEMEKADVSTGAGGKLDLIMHLLVTDANAVKVFVKPSLDTISLEDALKLIDERLENLEDIVTAQGGGELLLPDILGGGPYEIMFTEEETEEFALKSDLSKYATKESPVFTGAVTLGTRSQNKDAGDSSFAIGADTIASGKWTLVIGSGAAATADNAVATGFGTLASGPNSRAEGYKTVASGNCAHAEGSNTEASGMYAHAEGLSTHAAGTASYAAGFHTKANNYQHVIGTHNVEQTDGSINGGDRFTVGGGTSGSAPFNAFRVHSNGGVFGGEYHASGADYAEIYEWGDGNPDAEDRVGRFVVLDGERIRLAGPEDSPLDLLGIVSAHPSITGDSYEDQWRGMYLRDVFGRLLYEDAEAEDPEHPGQTVPERRRKLNPAYDPSQVYIPQSKRPEKAAVGLLGKLVLIDDGSCRVNGWCAAGPGGVAARSEGRTRFRVMSRLDPTHIRVNIMPQ